MAESNTRQTLNELLVDLFNFILYIQEKYMKEKGVPLTMYEVHLLENVSKIKNNTIGISQMLCWLQRELFRLMPADL